MMKNSGKINFFGKTDVGRQRANNEDAFVAEQLDGNTVLAIVIDGVGGYEGGEVAAEIAQQEIPSYLKEFNRGERLELLKQAVVCANNAIYDRRCIDTVRPHMGCVLTSALIDTHRKVVDMVHVGDTRLYQYHQRELRKLSHDHSYVGYCEENGELTEEQAMQHPRRNEISRAVGEEQHGVSDLGFLEAEEFTLLPNSTFLLCSDGLTDLVTSHHILEILEQPLSLEEKVQALIDAANEAGGKDNVTVVLVEYQTEEEVAQQQEEPITETTTQQVDETQTPNDNTLSDKSCRKDVILAVIAFLIVTLILPCLTLWHHQKTQKFSGQNPGSEKMTPIDTLWEDDMEVEDFTFMYDVNTDHPWSSYLSTDSNYVLRLEKLYEDSLGCSYRALIYEPEYWYRGETCYPPLGEEPTYVGYGTDGYYGYKDHYLEFSFVRHADDTYIFELSGYCRDWDSVLTSNPIPFPWLSEEDDYVVTYKKCDWDEIRKWWDREQARRLGR